jgi:heat shock protein HslJ
MDRFSGTYEEDGTSISLGPLMTMRMACEDEVMKAEQAYLTALATVGSWSASDEELVLFNAAGGEILRYEAGTSGLMP